ncbi:aspartate:alanine exchanger family transporter [Sorangium sp. So ce131]|uniref:aspartate:alanine exchanger family transporter n=1 Tax=Sorangium sp. So ce131 TaxID=3133282 RepID=UPI003F5D9259
MVRLLAGSPLLLLFVVSALGFLVGRLRIGGFHLGVAAVLFVGLGAGAVDPSLQLPEFVTVFGLALFVYTVGLTSGPGFFASLRRRGLRDALLAAGALLAAAGLAALAARFAGLRGAAAAGVFAGATTSTPALASALEVIKSAPEAAREALASGAVVGYSVTYPAGVLGTLGAIGLLQRLLRVDYEAELRSRRDARGAPQRLTNVTVRVTRDEALGVPAGELRRRHGLHVLFGRMRRGGQLAIATDATALERGDLVGVIGGEDDVNAAALLLGEATAEHLEFDRTQIDFRRVFVSRPGITERPLRELRLPERFGAIITRVRRGDVDILPDDQTTLELGDRVRVVAPRERMDAIARYLGDSLKAISEIDVITFSVGIALGLLLGSVPIPLPGGAPIKLGSAGGPLLVGLVLGRLGRTGPLVWTLPYGTNLTLRQLGVVMFLAGVGTRSGYSFAHTLAQGGAAALVGSGALITAAVAFGTLLVGYRLLRIPMGVLTGMLSGIQTQPAVLAFSLEQARSEAPNAGYASVYPVATLVKIVAAQLLVRLL